MRHYLSVLILLNSVALPAVAAHRAARPRAVQVIAMGSPPLPAADGRETSVPDASQAALARFRVHDLRRGWVERQLRTGFLAAPKTATTNVSEVARSLSSVAPAGVVPIEPVPLAPTSSIVTPAWMASPTAFQSPSPSFTPGCTTTAYSPSGLLTSSAEARRRGYFAMMSSIACEYGVPAGLFDALIIRESQYQPTIYSPKLAYGLTQLMPETARGLGVDRYDPIENLRGGARYLRAQLDRFGEYNLALGAYNAGPGRIRGGLLPNIAETQAYVKNVLRNWSRLSGLQPRTVNIVARDPFPSLPRDARDRQVSLSVF